MSVTASAAHKAYWRAQGSTDAEISNQWVLGCNEKAWDAVVKAVTGIVCPPADRRIKELEQALAGVVHELDEMTAARNRLDVTRSGIAELLGMPYDTAGSTTVANLDIAGLRKTAGLAYGTRREANDADAAARRKTELDATRPERDL